MTNFLNPTSEANLRIVFHNRQSKNKFFKDLLNDYEYNYGRYTTPYAFALIYLLNGNLSDEFLSSSTRQTDKFVLVEDRLYCIVFENMPESKALKGLSNKITQIEAMHFGIPIYSSIVYRNECNDVTDLINKASILLDMAIRENHCVSLDMTYWDS